MPKVTGPLTTTDMTVDTYATHDALLGVGGLREVATTTLRNAVSSFRRREGMLVYVAANTTYYRLKPSPWDYTDNDWVSVALGTALSTTVFDFPTPVNQWVISHSLGTYPQVMLWDTSGHEVWSDVTQVDISTIHVDFTAPQDGKAVLRP